MQTHLGVGHSPLLTSARIGIFPWLSDPGPR